MTSAGPFRIDWERELNPQQLEVVRAGAGPILVIAGAGSGKTRTLTYRVARLVEEGVPPAAILLLTFTNKAAREMLRRAEALLAMPVAVSGGTFHHAGLLALRRHGSAVGLPSRFTVADRDDAAALISDAAADVIGEKDKRFPKGEVLLDIVSMAANTGKEIGEILEQKYEAHAGLEGEIRKVAERYAEKKARAGVVDFDDLLTLWLRVLEESEEARAEYQSRFAYVLVDEYQDTNLLQARIVDRIAERHRNLMAVGDDAQSIYSFRGANFENIIRFRERYPDARICRLEINYRSTPEILAVANAAIALNRVQYPKELRCGLERGPKPWVVPCERPEDQAAFVARRIREMEDEGVPLDEIAVLYRSHFHALELQLELSRSDIPFEVRSGLRFFEQAHVKDAAAFLRVATNPKDETAWKRALRIFPKIGKVTADKVWAAVERSADPLGELSEGRLNVPKAASTGVEGARQMLAAISRFADRPWDQIEAILAAGYEAHLLDTYENAAQRLQDLKTLAGFSHAFATTAEFLSELALLASATETEQADATPERRVVLSTVHQAKGLEWTAVFVIWLVDGRFPDGRAISEGGEEEERRLFYVATTRAKRFLHFCHPVTGREGALFGVFQRTSRFLRDLPEELTEMQEPPRTAPRFSPRPPPEALGDERWMDGDYPEDEP